MIIVLTIEKAKLAALVAKFIQEKTELSISDSEVKIDNDLDGEKWEVRGVKNDVKMLLHESELSSIIHNYAKKAYGFNDCTIDFCDDYISVTKVEHIPKNKKKSWWKCVNDFLKVKWLQDSLYPRM